MGNTAFIVDSDKNTAESLGGHLRSLGFRCVSYSDFDDAFHAIANDDPCIALTELHVPGVLRAPEFITRTKQQYPRLPVVLISADARAKLVADCLGASFLAKPFSFEDVETIVKKFCSTMR
jgi:DNA-binding NtrC family response regulator